MTFTDVSTPIHILAASTALGTMMIPIFAKKGGNLHRQVGRVYVWAMGVAAATGAASSLWRLAFDPEPGHKRRALFLLYASLLAATSLSIGVRVLRTKQRRDASRHALDLGLPLVLCVSGLALVAYGFSVGAMLFIGFAPVGIFVGGAQLLFWLRPPRSRLAWLYEHMGGMIGSSIAALTAFAVVNAPRLHLPSASLAVWLTPTAVGVPILVIWRGYYQRRETARSAKQPSFGTASGLPTPETR